MKKLHKPQKSYKANIVTVYAVGNECSNGIC